MADKRTLIDGVLVVGVVLLGGIAWAQHTEIQELDEAIAKLDARITTRPVVSLASDAPAADPEARDVERPQHATKGTTVVSPARPATAPATGLVSAKAPGTAAFDPSNPEVRGQLREVIEEERQLERQERQQKRAQHRERRLRTQVEGLAEETAMDTVVQEQLTDMLVVEQAEASEIFRQAREDFSWGEAREKVTKLRTETDAKAKDLLEADEYDEYVKMRDEEIRQFTGGGRGRGPRNDSNGKKADNDAKR